MGCLVSRSARAVPASVVRIRRFARVHRMASNKRRSFNTGAGIAIGVGVGAALSAATDSPVWIGVGIAIGAAIGAASGRAESDDSGPDVDDATD